MNGGVHYFYIFLIATCRLLWLALCPISKHIVYEHWKRTFDMLLFVNAVYYLHFLDSFGPFSVNITSNNSFSLSWNSSVSSVCYSVEWWAKGQIPTFRPFYEKQTHKKITGETDSSTVLFHSPLLSRMKKISRCKLRMSKVMKKV